MTLKIFWDFAGSHMIKVTKFAAAAAFAIFGLIAEVPVPLVYLHYHKEMPWHLYMLDVAVALHRDVNNALRRLGNGSEVLASDENSLRLDRG